MKRLFLALLMALISTMAVWAQDWRYDEENELYFNCALIAGLKADFGEEDILKFADDDRMTVAEFFDWSFETCAEMDGDDAAGESDDAASEPEVIAVLADQEEFTLFDDGCSVRVADRFEEDLYVSLAGSRRGETSVDVYLPGESEKIDMPNVGHEEVNVYGIETPIRNEWVEGDSFPLGLYRFDVHIGDSTYRFEWQRADEAVNTIIVSCLDLKADSDFEVEVTAELADGELFPLEESGCHVGTIDLEAEFFSTVVSGTDRDSMSVEVTYPQMSTPVQMQHVESFVTDEGIPMRIEWVEAPNFPTGAYLISVTINERTRHFRWDRQDDAFRTIVLTCDPVESE
ncbi:MAG: hypothetical protein OXG78_02850 [Chloroflexi bacterium]|nr:hypothetical protein [Chloroflexota bacterium]